MLTGSIGAESPLRSVRASTVSSLGHDHPVLSLSLSLSLSRQCRLLSIGRSSLCYKPKGWNAETLALMRPVDKLFLKYPFYSVRIP